MDIPSAEFNTTTDLSEDKKPSDLIKLYNRVIVAYKGDELKGVLSALRARLEEIFNQEKLLRSRELTDLNEALLLIRLLSVVRYGILLNLNPGDPEFIKISYRSIHVLLEVYKETKSFVDLYFLYNRVAIEINRLKQEQ